MDLVRREGGSGFGQGAGFGGGLNLVRRGGGLDLVRRGGGLDLVKPVCNSNLL